MAAAIMASVKISPHEATDRLVVTIIDPCSARRDTTWKIAVAPSGREGQVPQLVADQELRAGGESHGH